MKTKRAYLVAPRKFEFREMNVEPKNEEVLVRIGSCGLCNYELNHWKGLLGTFPQSLGHEWNGTVIEKGKGVKNIDIGDRIAIIPKWGEQSGFSEYAIAEEDQCIKISNGIKLEHSIVEPLKCVITVLRASMPEVGDFAVVQGCGPMGLWSICALSGNMLSSIIAIDIDDFKLQKASRFGATHTINPLKINVIEEIKRITGSHMADFVIDCTGKPDLSQTGIDYLKTSRGRLVLMSSHEEACNKFDFRPAIAKAIQIIVPHWEYSIDHMDDTRRAVALLCKNVFKIEETITHVFKLDDIQKAFEVLENKPAGYIKGIIIP